MSPAAVPGRRLNRIQHQRHIRVIGDHLGDGGNIFHAADHQPENATGILPVRSSFMNPFELVITSSTPKCPAP
jgi:hypothetical protein